MHAAVTSAVWIELEARFPNRPVARDEGWERIALTKCGGKRNLRVDGRCRAADCGLRVTADAAVQVQARPESFIRLFDGIEIGQPFVEKSPFPRTQAR